MERKDCPRVIFKTYVIPSVPQIGLFLLPKEIHTQVLHQRRELIRDVLQRLGVRPQRVQQLVAGVEKLSRCQRGDGALYCSGQLGHVAAVMGGAEEEDRVRGDEDGVEMGDVL